MNNIMLSSFSTAITLTEIVFERSSVAWDVSCSMDKGSSSSPPKDMSPLLPFTMLEKQKPRREGCLIICLKSFKVEETYKRQQQDVVRSLLAPSYQTWVELVFFHWLLYLIPQPGRSHTGHLPTVYLFLFCWLSRVAVLIGNIHVKHSLHCQFCIDLYRLLYVPWSQRFLQSSERKATGVKPLNLTFMQMQRSGSDSRTLIGTYFNDHVNKFDWSTRLKLPRSG